MVRIEIDEQTFIKIVLQCTDYTPESDVRAMELLRPILLAKVEKMAKREQYSAYYRDKRQTPE